jgi:hypothetical protein
MTDFIDEDWGRVPAVKSPAPDDPVSQEDRRWGLIFESVFGSLFIVALVPVLVAWFGTCWRFWGEVALWCVALGREAVRSPDQAVPWLLAALFAVLACRRHGDRVKRA